MYFIVCTLPSKYVRHHYKIKNQIECLVATTNMFHYYCKCPSVKLSENRFMFTSSHLSSKIIHTIQKYFPFIHIHIEKRVDWAL